MRCKFIAWAAVALIGAAPFAGAQADVLYDNLGQPNAGVAGSDLLATAADGGGGPVAVSFSTGSQGVVLSAVSLLLEGTYDTAGSISAELFSDNPTGSSSSAPAPGSELASIGTIADSSLPSSFGTVTIDPATEIILAANTRYWVELLSSGSTPTTAIWATSATALGVGVVGEYDWNNYAGNLNSTALNQDPSVGYAPDMMAVMAVPEPTSLSLLALGLIGLVSARRRRYV